LWASGARAIRSSTPFDHDVVERVGGVNFLTGNPDFEAERVDAFEIGYRGQPFSLLSFTASFFYNEYNDLRSIETASPTVFLPLRWDNFISGSTHGFATWAKWQLTDWWRLSPGVRILRSNLKFDPGASRLLTANQNSNDPSTQASLGSSMNFARELSFDLFFRYVGGLPDPALDAYTELNARLGWRPAKELEFSLNGANLLHRRHRESPILTDPEISRNVYAEARWRF
jgi:iron complex outermembrane recepter protein